METQTELPGTTDKRRGRRDADGSEEVIKFKPIRDAAKDIMRLMNKAEKAKTDCNEAFKGLAERSGTNVANLKRLFKASYNGNFSDVRRDVDQQSVLFEEIGELQGGKDAGE